MQDDALRKKRGVIPCSFEEYVYKYCHHRALLPQTHWLSDELDFIGKFENLHKDFAIVCNALNIDVDLPHLLNRETNYIEHYNDRLRHFVEVRYADEIRLFGYKFENGFIQ